jgi:hypothetical protein
MGETQQPPFQLSFNSALQVEIQGARVTSGCCPNLPASVLISG